MWVLHCIYFMHIKRQLAHLPNFAVWCWSVPYIFNCFDFGVLFILIFVETSVNLFSFYFDADGKPDIRVVHVRYLNFVLRSEIFMNSVGQLWASHLILSCNLVYSIWQPFRQALLVDSPLLSYFDVRHPNFLPPNLTIGEARDFGPRLVRVESLVPVRDDSANSISHNHTVHRPIKQPQAQVHSIEQAASKLVSSSEVDTDQAKTRWWSNNQWPLTIFCPAPIQQRSNNKPKAGVKLLPSSSYPNLKKQHTANQLPKALDAPPKTPPLWTSRNIVI